MVLSTCTHACTSWRELHVNLVLKPVDFIPSLFHLSYQSLEDRLRLPIASRAAEIVMAVQRHQVVVIKGNTGCGKTTQVPQFILDNMIANQNGADCNIVVTQVRTNIIPYRENLSKKENFYELVKIKIYFRICPGSCSPTPS